MQIFSKPLVIRDEIHGDISFDGVLRAAIDHPNFQRLRHIQQLGLAYYVFPCASHTRFQHSLGCSFLAGRYFDQVIQSWRVSPFNMNGQVDHTQFFADRTRGCLDQVANHEESFAFWSRVVRLAGLLHDVGHGPWSHTFETLRVAQDFRKAIASLEPISQDYLKDVSQLKHEEIGLLYLHEILGQLEKDSILINSELFFLAIAPLINKKLLREPFASSLETRLTLLLRESGIRGGIDLHRLVRPFISGPFDVDRIDYIQRDGRNCGVHIGGIEWGRILGQVVPCLAIHENTSGEPRDVVLVSNAKNQHVLDDFTFSLYQMYAQVYLHPKIVGLEESIRRELGRAGVSSEVITLELHRSLSDEKFADFLTDRIGAQSIRRLLMREKEATFDVLCYLSDSQLESELDAMGYEKVEVSDRPFMKDRMGVFLFNAIGDGRSQSKCLISSWFETSPIAKEFHSMSYSPRVWVRKRGRS